MNLVVDASVFVAAFRSLDAHHADSVAFLAELRRTRPRVFCPTIVLLESACAIVRLADDPRLTERVIELINSLPGIELVPLTSGFAWTAAESGARCRLRGADACYLAVSQQSVSALIAWDREMLDRGAAVVTTRTPAEWLKEQTGKEGR